ncbi:chitinase [Parasediminibacterium sp. JCM 36343]|uniref:chitinase n=1 Tax=Parasediminibacterium sp. JCM 36343 TaxID=3374279 RepID=UPI003979FD49
MAYLKYFIFLLFVSCATSASTENPASNTPTVKGMVSKAQFEAMFPHRDKLYSYEAFIKATERFPKFATEGTELQNKRELMAFFANVAHETTDGWPEAEGGPYVWGLVYKEEQACLKKPCPVYNTGGTSKYKPVPGKNYYGRGPLQLSYAYNYGLAGEDLHLPLLQKPELVCTNGTVAFTLALWFWMREQLPKPSCHDVMCGKWVPTAKDITEKRVPGFGMVINIINGGLECNTNVKEVSDNRNERIGFYKFFCKQMNIPVEDTCDCRVMGNYK